MGEPITNAPPNFIDLAKEVRLSAIKNTKIFKSLRPEEIKQFESISVPLRFKKGSVIFGEGDPAKYYHVIQDGFVRLYKCSVSGKILTFTIAGPGETLNGLALSTDSYFLSAQAMCDVTVMRTASRDFLDFLFHRPAFAFELIAIIARRTKIDYERTVDIVGEDVEQRLLFSLYTLASKFGNTLQLTREELANFAGTTTETTIRILSNLKKQGVIGSSGARGEIVISDLARLRTMMKSITGFRY
jgi:CRP-like cAMP-binding protein